MRRASFTIWLFVVALMVLLVPSGVLRATRADADHQYAPLREVQLSFKDFSFPTLEGTVLNLREQARGSSVVIVSFFAAWCHNSNYDVKTLNELYFKYRDQGLAIIGVCEYSSADELRDFIAKHQPAYPICFEGDHQTRQRDTTHFYYRQKVGDKKRKWGTPLNIVIRAEDRLEQGDTVAKRVLVATGELIKKEVEELIQQK